MFLRPQQKQGDADQLHAVGEFGEEPGADGQSQPEPGGSPAVVQRVPKQQDGQRPEKHAQRINGHQDRADRQHGHYQGHQQAPQGGAFVVKPPRQHEKQPAHAAAQQHGKKTDAEHRVAKHFGPQRDGPRDGRAFVPIRSRQMFRPQPVVGFVGHQPDLRGKPEAITDDGQEKKNRQPRRAGIAQEGKHLVRRCDGWRSSSRRHFSTNDGVELVFGSTVNATGIYAKHSEQGRQRRFPIITRQPG